MPKAETPQRAKRQTTEPKPSRSSKKGDELAMSDADAVCISDEDERSQKSIDSYHPKSKNPANVLSRKYAKKRQGTSETLLASTSSNGVPTTTVSSSENSHKKSTVAPTGGVKSSALPVSNATNSQKGRAKPTTAKSRKRKSAGDSGSPRKIAARDVGNRRICDAVAQDPEDPILVLGSSEEINPQSPSVETVTTMSGNRNDNAGNVDSDDEDSSNIFIRTSLDLKRKAPVLKSVEVKKTPTDSQTFSPSAKRVLTFPDSAASQSGIRDTAAYLSRIRDTSASQSGISSAKNQLIDVATSTDHSPPLSSSVNGSDPPAGVIELSSESVPVPNLVLEVGTLGADDQLIAAEDWSQPMEQEIFHSPVKILPKLNDKEMEQVSTTVHNFSPSSSKISLSISRTPQKAKTSSSIKSPAEDTKKLPHSSQSPSKKTPSKFLRSPSRSPKKGSPSKTSSPKKYNLAALSGNVLLEHSINECKRYAQMTFKMNATNRKVADDYLVLDLPEKILLHHLLVRKWSWIREVDMKYDKVVHHMANSLTALESKGFLERMSSSEDLKVILDELKLPELVELSKLQNLDKKGTKKDLVDRLTKFASRQGGLGFTAKNLKSVMKDRAVKSLGRCWKVAEGPRIALQQIFEASMCPVFLEGQFYTFQERLRGMELLMNEVKFNGRKLVPFSLSEEQLFTTPTQFDEYVSSVIMKYDILAASIKRDHAEGARLAAEVLQNLKIYLGSTALHEFLQRTPRHLWRYTACSNYSSALDKGIEFLKRSKNYKTALEACNVLLQQDIFRRHARGHWYAEKILLMDKHLKSSPEEIFVVLLNGLEEELTPIGRLELSKKAEGILNKKKNGLLPDKKLEILKLIRMPKLNHPVKEIKATEAPNVSTGKRQTFVELTAEGEQVYSNVEQTARNEYMGDFPEGLHDEGSFLKNIILAAFWPVIYTPVEKAFLSRYQHCPLDWGTTAFYKARHGIIKDHMAKLRSGGLDGIMISITETITSFCNFHSIVNWSYVSFDMLPTIRKLLACLTVDKFLLLAEYLLENYRERRSGWPDLTLWNFCALRFLLVEVKSPNDELSFKQIVWLEKFAEMGIPVEECRVNPTNKGKKRQARALAIVQSTENC
ncbi:VRR-NUC domain [Nesidiocoris tenuis]|uniref:Fanconi-associated nuclease n=1 Tax=Nesidiocoris tenuis TaxID=355587 RepID=A0ABN7A6Q3_9HEMI|nr:VRR-NUC domain [Nesidiocoris tenuis]